MTGKEKDPELGSMDMDLEAPHPKSRVFASWGLTNQCILEQLNAVLFEWQSVRSEGPQQVILLCLEALRKFLGRQCKQRN